jgi:CHAD domain-containing protein
VAKAKPIPDLSAEDSYADAAARIVSVRAGELTENAQGVLDTGDIERVHDMRVATRRLRAVLEIFAPCFPKRLHRGVLRDVKVLADALGERRDPDVHIAALDGFAAGVKASSRPGVALLADRFRAEQAEANVRLAEALRRTQESDLEGRLRELVGRARA